MSGDEFVENPELRGSKEHVHFAAGQVEAHNLEIIVKQSDSKADIHLGFLQIHHHYEVKFCIKDDLGEDLEYDSLQNVYAQIVHAMPTEDGEGHEFVINFHAHKEKLVQELLTIRSCIEDNKTFTLVLHARVLGKGKGTPALKNGIRCTKVDIDEDSDALSDWQGF